MKVLVGFILFCHAKYTYMSQTLWRGLSRDPRRGPSSFVCRTASVINRVPRTTGFWDAATATVRSRFFIDLSRIRKITPSASSAQPDGGTY
jgi:hypothetical protein